MNSSNQNSIVESLREYNLKKNIKDQLKVINPLMCRKETDIKVHLKSALVNGVITKREFDFLKVKMELGRMCLELEKVLDGIYVTILFYDIKRNHIFHGAAPSIPVEFFDSFSIVNDNNMLDENCSACGRAIFTKKVVQTDIGTSKLWSNFGKTALEYGFKSCTSIPFFTEDCRLAGTFAHYSKKPNNRLTEDEVEMIKEKVSMFSLEIQMISDCLHEYTQTGNGRLTITPRKGG